MVVVVVGVEVLASIGDLLPLEMADFWKLASFVELHDVSASELPYVP